MKKSVEIVDKVVDVEIEEISGEKFVNCKVNDIEMIDGRVLKANPIEFVELFKVGVSVDRVLDKQGLKINKKDLYVNNVKRMVLEDVLKELQDCWFIVSTKTAMAYKNPRMVIIEKNSEGKCLYEFEIKSE